MACNPETPRQAHGGLWLKLAYPLLYPTLRSSLSGLSCRVQGPGEGPYACCPELCLLFRERTRAERVLVASPGSACGSAEPAGGRCGQTPYPSGRHQVPHPLTAGLHTSPPSSAAADSAIGGGSGGHCPRRPPSRSPPFQPRAPGSSIRTRDWQGGQASPCQPGLCTWSAEPREEVTAEGEDRRGPCAPAGQVEAKAGLPGAGASALPVLSLHPNPSRLILGEGDSQIPSSPSPKTQHPQCPAQGGPSSQCAQHRGSTTHRLQWQVFPVESVPYQGRPVGPPPTPAPNEDSGVQRGLCLSPPNLTQVLGHQGPSPSLAPPTAGAARLGPDPSPLTAQETRLLALPFHPW